MFFGKKLPLEKEVEPFVATEVYSCIGDACNGWMRKAFVSEDLHCPMCGSSMEMGVRDLPKI
jgi:Cold-inducible protein YdjO